MTSTIEAKLQQVVDLNEIQVLLARYCHGIDKKIEDLFMSIWADEASYVLPRGEATGRDAIRELVHKVWREVPKCHHHITNPLIEVDGDRAAGTTDVFYYRQTADDVLQLLSGTYSVEFAKVDGEWRTTSLRFASFDTVSPLFEENVTGQRGRA